VSEIDWSIIRDQALADFSIAALPATLKLPALPHVVTMFLECSSDPKANAKDLAKIIETDSGLTLELLRYVNSSFIGLRNKAKNVQSAISLLGIRQCRSHLVTVGMQAAVMARKSRLINQTCFWNACLQKALFAREVAVMLRADPEVAFSGALLQDFLLPVLTNDLFDDYLEFIQNRPIYSACLVDFEQERYAWDHALAGACLAHRWHLPDEITCCLLFHHAGLQVLGHPQLGRTAVAAVAVSALLPDQIRQQYDGLEQLALLEQQWPAFSLHALAEKVDQQQSEQGLGVKNDFPLARRCRPILQEGLHVDAAHFNDGSLLHAGH